MDYTKTLDILETYKVIPVVKLDSVEDALPLADALAKGNLPVAEITFRTQAAEACIREIASKRPEMIIGAGTVINIAQAQKAIDAGAQFIVSPGISRELVAFCTKNNMPILPGVCTPSELMIALEFDLPVVKFFPAKQYGGLETIKALAAPFPQVRFMPTGGINTSNIGEFLACPKIIACGGSWMVDNVLIQEKNYAKITELTCEAIKITR